MVESQAQADSDLKQALDEASPDLQVQASDKEVEARLYDEDGKPKNALYESLAKKKANSVSIHTLLRLSNNRRAIS